MDLYLLESTIRKKPIGKILTGVDNLALILIRLEILPINNTQVKLWLEADTPNLPEPIEVLITYPYWIQKVLTPVSN